MSLLVPPRRNDPEILDGTGHGEGELAAVFRDLATINRTLGGTRALLEAIDPFLAWAAPGERFDVLDVGCGGADLPLAVAAHGRAKGIDVRVVGVEKDPAAVAVARKAAEADPAVSIVAGDAFRLDFPEKSFDVVAMSLFLHHFEYQEAVMLLRRLTKLARKATIVNDLQRHRLPWAFIAIASRLARWHPMIRHDGPLSVLRGFSEEELRAACEDAGASMATVQRRWPFRWVVTIPARA